MRYLGNKKNRKNFNYEASKDEVLIIGVPVYASQIPSLVVPILKQLEGIGQPAILISVYGNVDEGLALEQMQSLLETKFSIIAAASFIGEHSYSKEDFEIGHNRPEEKDLEKAEQFGEKIKNKLENWNDKSNTKLGLSQIKKYIAKLFNKANIPQSGVKKVINKPEYDTDKCNFCNICVERCPTEAINPETLKIDESLCIRCMSCAKICPKEARDIEYKFPFLVRNFFKLKNSYKRDQPKLYI